MTGKHRWRNKNSKADEKRSLTVDDLIKYLARVSDLQSDSRTGNLDLSTGLRQLTTALKPYGRLPVAELSNVLRSSKSLQTIQSSSPREKIVLPSNLESVSHKQVEEIICNQKFSKFQLVQVGVFRFGVSHSRLMRLNKNDVIGTIRAAMDHEKSLDAISQEARRSGEIRSP